LGILGILGIENRKPKIRADAGLRPRGRLLFYPR
jgi:hypothetical protein